MRIYSLRAIDPASREWGISLHHNCLVNAESELAAREAAARTLAYTTPTASPWMSPDLVSCREVGHMNGPEPPSEVVFVPIGA